MLNHWEATKWLHKKLQDKAINQKDFRLGVEHLFVCNKNGWHPKSNGEMADLTGLLKTEVVRGNRKLEKIGFLRVVKHPGMGRWVTNDHYVLIGHTVSDDGNIHRTQMDVSVSDDLHPVTPVQDSVSGALVSDGCANQSLTETESSGSARYSGVGAVAPTESNGDSESSQHGLAVLNGSPTADPFSQEVPPISPNGDWKDASPSHRKLKEVRERIERERGCLEDGQYVGWASKSKIISQRDLEDLENAAAVELSELVLHSR